MAAPAAAQAATPPSTLAPADDAAARAAIDSLRSLGPLRHLQLRVVDGTGRVLLERADDEPPGWALRALMTLDGQRAAPGPEQTVSWTIARPDGAPWTVSLVASPESEQREALSNLLGMFALLAGCCALMLVVMRWNLRRAFRPLQAMLGAIARVEQQDLAPLRALPPMPIRELDAIAAALRHLADALARAEHERRLLSQKMLTLQEDERQRLARDLHDEFGQRLTALRVDAAWLQRRCEGDAVLQPVIAGMIEQCSRIQQDVRGLLARLQPLGGAHPGPGAGAAPDPEATAGRLRALLQALAASWSMPVSRDVDGLGDDARALPRERLLAVYRITQEALTNAARHAGGAPVAVRVRIEPGDGAGPNPEQPAPDVLDWQVQDDGPGLADPDASLQRGNGLAGIRQRVWALGGVFTLEASGAAPEAGAAGRARGEPGSTGAGPRASGLRLHARLPLPALAPLGPWSTATPAATPTPIPAFPVERADG